MALDLEDTTGAPDASSDAGPADVDSGSSSGADGMLPADDEGDSSGGVVDPVPDLPEPADPCPGAGWPDDGSEVLEFVGESSVVEWGDAGVPGIYFSYLSEESPVPGKQTLGLTTTSENASVFNFGATVEQMSALELRGKRIRMRALAALSGVEAHANLWLRIDDTEGSLNLDNGSDQPAFGTTDTWVQHEIVMDVPDEATTLVFGSLLTGHGNYAVADPVFEVVSEDVPTTSPNRRRPWQSLSCAEPTDEFVQEIVHYSRSDSWGPTTPLVWGDEFGRDEEVLYDGVPTMRLGGELNASLQGGVLWVGQQGGRRLRMTLPVRGSFVGDVRLIFGVQEGEATVTRTTEPLSIVDGADWATFAVVAEMPDNAHAFASVGVEVDGTGELWLGYGVIEEVTEDVALSPIAE